MTAPHRRCACGKAALPGDAFCGECAVAIGEPFDEDYLFQYARQQQRVESEAWPPYVYERCPACRHSLHGLACEMAGCDCGISWREGMA